MSPSAWCMSRKARICRAGSVRNAEVSIICRWFTKRTSIGIEICPNKKMKIHMRDMFLKDHPKIYVMTVYLSQVCGLQNTFIDTEICRKKIFFSFFRMCDMLVKRSDRDLSNDSIFNRNDQKLQELHQK